MDLITIFITSHVRNVGVFFSSTGVTSKESSKGNSKIY